MVPSEQIAHAIDYAIQLNSDAMSLRCRSADLRARANAACERARQLRLRTELTALPPLRVTVPVYNPVELGVHDVI